jgi:hypothetical protein
LLIGAFAAAFLGSTTITPGRFNILGIPARCRRHRSATARRGSMGVLRIQWRGSGHSCRLVKPGLAPQAESAPMAWPARRDGRNGNYRTIT